MILSIGISFRNIINCFNVSCSVIYVLDLFLHPMNRFQCLATIASAGAAGNSKTFSSVAFIEFRLVCIKEEYAQEC